MTPYNQESAKNILKERGFEQAFFDKNSFALGAYQYFVGVASFTLIVNNGLPTRRVIENETKSSLEHFVKTIPKQLKKQDHVRQYKKSERIRLFSVNYTKDSVVISQYEITQDCFVLQEDRTHSYINDLGNFKAKCLNQYGITINPQRCGIHSKQLLRIINKF
jgi:hypothetical protein